MFFYKKTTYPAKTNCELQFRPSSRILLVLATAFGLNATLKANTPAVPAPASVVQDIFQNTDLNYAKISFKTNADVKLSSFTYDRGPLRSPEIDVILPKGQRVQLEYTYQNKIVIKVSKNSDENGVSGLLFRDPSGVFEVALSQLEYDRRKKTVKLQMGKRTMPGPRIVQFGLRSFEGLLLHSPVAKIHEAFYSAVVKKFLIPRLPEALTQDVLTIGGSPLLMRQLQSVFGTGHQLTIPYSDFSDFHFVAAITTKEDYKAQQAAVKIKIARGVRLNLEVVSSGTLYQPKLEKVTLKASERDPFEIKVEPRNDTALSDLRSSAGRLFVSSMSIDRGGDLALKFSTTVSDWHRGEFSRSGSEYICTSFEDSEGFNKLANKIIAEGLPAAMLGFRQAKPEFIGYSLIALLDL